MKRQILTAAITLGVAVSIQADTVHKGEMGFPEFTQPTISGAPKLKDPFLVMGSTKPVMTEKHGLAAPALWDWDGDGKRDLLVGEFETGGHELGDKGSTIRVYKNVGADSDPKFTDEFEYARDTAGNVMLVPQWCCIGFTPMFYDLNNDGMMDMVTGQYHPGHVTWFRGSEKGFEPGVHLEQEGDPEAGDNHLPDTDINSFGYWNYSSVSFGDFTGDGKLDMIVGGSALRISENIGTKENPKFARRELLLDINGEPLKTKVLSQQDIERMEEYGSVPAAGSYKTQMFVVDWDNDGVLDILATDDYTSSKSRAVSFFRGVKTEDGHRFEPGIDLLAAKGGLKALPGSGNRIYVDDWNKDGVQDLILGASVATIDGEFSDDLSWEWESVNGVESAGKDPGRNPIDKPRYQEPESWDKYSASRKKWEPDASEEQLKKSYAEWTEMLNGVNAHQQALFDKGWHKMIHQGRVYVFLGEDTGTKAVAATADATKAKKKKRTPPVQYTMLTPAAAAAGGTVDLTVNFDVRKGWYIYAPTGRNEPNGMVETRVSFDLPEGFEFAGDMVLPPHHPKGMFEIYDGQGIKMTQPIKVDSGVAAGEYTISAQLRYQTCNKEMCLPPATEKFTATVVVK